MECWHTSSIDSGLVQCRVPHHIIRAGSLLAAIGVVGGAYAALTPLARRTRAETRAASPRAAGALTCAAALGATFTVLLADAHLQHDWQNELISSLAAIGILGAWRLTIDENPAAHAVLAIASFGLVIIAGFVFPLSARVNWPSVRALSWPLATGATLALGASFSGVKNADGRWRDCGRKSRHSEPPW